MSFPELKGRVAVISGASKGLGRAMALALADQGVNMALLSRDAALLSNVVAEVRQLGVEAESFRIDITSEAEVDTTRDAVLKRFGAAHIVINNAGINVRKPIQEFTYQEWRSVLDTNLTGAFLLSRAFVPALLAAKWGRVISMTSIMSHIALPGRSAYCASKAGLLGFTKAFALEMAPHNVTVNAISPGPFGTDMNVPIMNNPELNQQFVSRIPVGRWGKVEDIGQLAVYLCSDAASFITGTDFLIDGGWTAQ